MLRADESARRRFAFLGGVIAVFMGGLALSGVVQRFSSPPSSEDSINPDDIAKARENARKFRELRNEAATLGQKGNWSEVVRFLDNPANSRITTPFLRAEAALRAGQIEDAKKGFLAYLPGDNPVGAATRLYLDNKTVEYQNLCEKTIASVSLPEKRQITPDEATTANNSAWLCVLGPKALKNYQKAIDLAKKGVDGIPERDKANFMNTVGAIQWRAGQPKDAITTLTAAEKIQSEPFNWPFLAMAYHDMGNNGEANRYFTRLRAYLTQSFGRPPEASRHELLLFFHEAEATLGMAQTSTK